MKRKRRTPTTTTMLLLSRRPMTSYPLILLLLLLTLLIISLFVDETDAFHQLAKQPSLSMNLLLMNRRTSIVTTLLTGASSPSFASSLLLSSPISRTSSSLIMMGTSTSSSSAAAAAAAGDDNDTTTIPYKEGKVQVSRRQVGGKEEQTFSLGYRIYNPTSSLTPLVMIHGGPSLPSQYMYPIVSLLNNDDKSRQQRPIIFYDQLGCGQSDKPKDLKLYSTTNSINDLNTILDVLLDQVDEDGDGGVTVTTSSKSSTTTTKKYHLFGHSYGGLLAYNFLASQSSDSSERSPAPSKCRSLILCNASISMKLVHDEYDRLYKQNPLTFWKEHVIRRVGDSGVKGRKIFGGIIGNNNNNNNMPPALQDAMKDANTCVWGGMDVVVDDVALPRRSEQEQHDTESTKTTTTFPQHVLIVTGGYDFGLKASTTYAWKDYLLLSDCSKSDIQSIHFEDGAHYPFYENPTEFGQTLENFLNTIDQEDSQGK